jgi:C-terminal processing protease CtpA/Prc
VRYDPMEDNVPDALREIRRSRMAVKRRETLGLGLSLGKRHDGVIVVSKVEEGRSAAKSNQVFKGDRVMGVATQDEETKEWNWVFTQTSDLKDVARALKSGEENEVVKLRLRGPEDGSKAREVILRITPDAVR